MHVGTPPDAALDADSETHPALIVAAGGGSFWRRGVPIGVVVYQDDSMRRRPLPDQLVDLVDVVDLFLVNA